jgi:hypothetical protein
VKHSGRDTEELEQAKGRNRETDIHEGERERERGRGKKSVTLGEGQSMGDVFCVQMMATSIVEEEELKVWFSFRLE